MVRSPVDQRGGGGEDYLEEDQDGRPAICELSHEDWFCRVPSAVSIAVNCRVRESLRNASRVSQSSIRACRSLARESSLLAIRTSEPVVVSDAPLARASSLAAKPTGLVTSSALPLMPSTPADTVFFLVKRSLTVAGSLLSLAVNAAESKVNLPPLVSWMPMVEADVPPNVLGTVPRKPRETTSRIWLDRPRNVLSPLRMAASLSASV